MHVARAVANERDDPLPDAILPRRQFVKMLVWVRNHRGKLLVACALVAGDLIGRVLPKYVSLHFSYLLHR